MSNAPQLPALLTSALRLLPKQPLEFALERLVISMAQRHPDLFDRLGPHASKTIGIAPSDVPVVFLLRPAPGAPGLEVHPDHPQPACDALISGPFFALIDLAEGRLDGDALFFSRDIRIEGDVEAVLALRNALDGEDVDFIREVMAPLGVFAAGPERVAKRCFELLRSAIQTAAQQEAVQR